MSKGVEPEQNFDIAKKWLEKFFSLDWLLWDRDIKIGCSIPVLESKVGICLYAYNHANASYTCGQKLNNKKSVTMTVTTPRPALTIAAAVVMTAAITAVALLGLHIQILCLQFVYVILNHLKISTRFELAGKIWQRICEVQNGFGTNLDDSFNSSTTKVLMSVSQEWVLTITSNSYLTN